MKHLFSLDHFSMGSWVPCLQEFVAGLNDFSLQSDVSFRQGAQNLPFNPSRGSFVERSLVVIRPDLVVSSSVASVFVSMRRGWTQESKTGCQRGVRDCLG